MLLGYIVISGQGETIANDSVGFSVQIIGLFTSTIGNWVFVLIAATIIAVMYSTLLALVDAFPRLIVNISEALFPKINNSIKESNLFLMLFALLFVLVGAVYYLLMSSFTEFIDFVTATGFIITPIIALFNHVIIFSSDIPLEERPGPVLRIWSLSMIVVFAVIALLWLYFRISG